MQYHSFSAFIAAIGESFRDVPGRLPRPFAWFAFLLGGLFLYGEINGPTTILLLGRQADGVVVEIRYVRGRNTSVIPVIRYTLPDGSTASFHTSALLGRDFTVGERLRIRYLPFWRERGEIFSFGQLFSPLIIGWVGACLFFAGGLAVLRGRKQRVLDKEKLDAFIASHTSHRTDRH
jgi:hypothetical protein